MYTYNCPYCRTLSCSPDPITKEVSESYQHSAGKILETDSGVLTLRITECPQCHTISVTLIGRKPFFFYSYPPSGTILLPDYIPQAIQADYMEAKSIMQTSPKASATLARRCLQGMIHDFWNIHEKNLNAEISRLKSYVPATQWLAIDGLRKIGNIGAHMESDIDRIIDVDPHEAQQLLKLIELLLEKWYIARHDEESLLTEISEIAQEKETARKSSDDKVSSGGANTGSQ